MKRLLLHFIFVLTGIITLHAQELTVCTYNVRNKNSSDTEAGNGWNTRRSYIINFINFQQPDLLGVQEALSAQMTDMANGLTGYAYIGVGRNNGGTSGEYSAIFYRKERMLLLDNGEFWLSDTPYTPSKGFVSKGGSDKYYRICTWGKFYDKATKKIVYIFNSHFDLDETNRQQSYYLIRNKIKEIASTSSPVIIMGDLNAGQTGETYKLFNNSTDLYDCYVKAKQRFMTNGTNSGFNAKNFKHDNGDMTRIDHIFVTRVFNISAFAVLNPCYYSTDGTADYHLKAYSDHNPVIAKLSYKTTVPSVELSTTPPPVVNGVYQLSSPEELLAFSHIVNGKAGYTQDTAAKAVLLNDIDMKDMDTWLPIGSNATPFTGTFDGQGHSILNITVKTNKSHSGLFGKTSNATIKNFHLSGTITVADGTGEHGMVGSASNSTITDVHSALNITTSKINNATDHIGGIAGSLGASSSISRCSYAGTITDAGTNTIGGIVGYADQSNNTISYSINYGKVSTKGNETFAGGILGYVNYAGIKVSHCANVGNVTGNKTCTGQIIGKQVKAMSTLPSNLYYMEGEEIAAFGSSTHTTSATGATAKTKNDVTRGELTILLNKGKNESDHVFFQNLNEGDQTDPYPIIGGYPEHKIVYQGAFGQKLQTTDNTDYRFFVNKGGQLAELPLINDFTTPVDFTAEHATYCKEETNTWGTIYLPFAVASSDSVQFYEIVPEQTEGSILAITPCEMLEAYTPGIYCINGDSLKIEAYNMPVAVPPNNKTISYGNFLFTGTLNKKNYTEGYVFNGNSLKFSTGSVTTNPFEVYVTTNGTPSQEVTLYIKDATGIQDLNDSPDQNTIYNLSGQRLVKMQKGINIINGKKYIQK